MELKSKLKNKAKSLFYHSGLFKILLESMRHDRYAKLLILTYHKIYVATDGHQYIGIPGDLFEEHIRFIRNNFKVTSINDWLENMNSYKKGEIYIAVNLDDGYMDNYLNAYPVLKKYDIPATVFLTTDFIGKKHVFWWDRVFNIVSSAHADEININIESQVYNFKLDKMVQREHAVRCINNALMKAKNTIIEETIEKLELKCRSVKIAAPYAMLGWDQIREMNRNGITFGAHTKTHKNLCMLNDKEILRELIESKETIEQQLRVEIKEFSYPFGLFNERVRNLVEEAGFRYGRLILKGFNTKDTDKFLLHAMGGGQFSNLSCFSSRIASLFLIKKNYNVEVEKL